MFSPQPYCRPGRVIYGTHHSLKNPEVLQTPPQKFTTLSSNHVPKKTVVKIIQKSVARLCFPSLVEAEFKCGFSMLVLGCVKTVYAMLTWFSHLTMWCSYVQSVTCRDRRVVALSLRWLCLGINTVERRQPTAYHAGVLPLALRRPQCESQPDRGVTLRLALEVSRVGSVLFMILINAWLGLFHDGR